jgi:hydroxymethylpyrimidine/phosphomethylpyrimidine kinase
MTDAPPPQAGRQPLLDEASLHEAHLHENRGRVLIIAGSDSGGGAGVQADIKTVTALGGYAATAITAITVQNTLGVSAVFPLPPELVVAQARAVFDDIGADAIKLGMLGEVRVVDAVADWLDSLGEVPLVVDPVMIAKGGQSLLEPLAVEALSERLIPRATLLTPNAPEAATLTGLTVETTDDLRRAGEALLRLGASAVLMKGGHIEGLRVIDILMTPLGETRFESGRIDSRHTHGTGCTLASACAFGLARGWSLDVVVTRARDYVRGAIANAPGFGAGHGPLNHGWLIQEQS